VNNNFSSKKIVLQMKNFFSSQKLYYVIIIFLIALNILLIVKNVERQNKINSLVSEIKSIEKNSSHLDVLIKKIKINLLNNEISLITIIDEKGCIDCILNAIKGLNKLKKDFKEKIEVFYLGDRKQYLNILGADFDYRNIKSIEEIMDVKYDSKQPINFLIDKNNNVHQIFISEPSFPDRTIAFYNNVNYLFNLIYKY
jgi:hypothetical protein